MTPANHAVDGGSVGVGVAADGDYGGGGAGDGLDAARGAAAGEVDVKAVWSAVGGGGGGGSPETAHR